MRRLSSRARFRWCVDAVGPVASTARLGLRHPHPAARRRAGTPPAPDTSMKQVPGSTLSFTRQQISDGFGPADWFPGDHPAMPDIVAHGKRPDARACGLCHYPNGKGRQENAGVSGLAGLLLHPADE